MRRLFSRISAFFTAAELDGDFDTELHSHLEMLAEDYQRLGMPPAEARRAARIHFGGAQQLREAHRATRGLPFLDTLTQDVRYALRGLRRNPGFLALAVLTLAIGIGVNTAVFTVYDAAELRPLQAADPGRLVQLGHIGRNPSFSYPEYAWYRDHSRSFTGMAAMTNQIFSMSRATEVATPEDNGIAGVVGLQIPRALGGSEPVNATVVSGNYFQVLGVSAAFGRTFLPEEDSTSAPAVAMLSDRFWRRHFAHDPAILGRRLILNGIDVAIVGIAPPNFGGTWLTEPDLWTPLALRARAYPSTDLLHNRANECCRLYGRLSPSVSPGQAREELNALAAGFTNDSPGLVVGRVSLGGQPGDSPELAGPVLLLAATGLVLLIACANVASLLLARSAARQREIVIRLAIGASRARIVRQLLTESAVTSLCAAAAGMVFAWWALRLLLLQVAASPFAEVGAMALNITPDHRVLAYLLFLSAASTIGFGLAPALEASRSNLNSGLKSESAAFGGRMRKSRLRDLMVGTQVSVCLVLLIAAGLLARASARAYAVDLGFDYRNIVSLEAVFPPAAAPAQIAATRVRLAEDLARLPEVQSLAVASRLPLVHGGMRSFTVAANRASLDMWYTLVTPSYFDTLRLPIVRGRNFAMHEAREGNDYDGSPAIVSESTARLLWGNEDPIGKQIAFGPRQGRDEAHSISSVVIGVAKDVRSWRMDRVDNTAIYLPVTTAFGGTAGGNNGRPEGAIALRGRWTEGRTVAAVQRLLQTSYRDLQVSIGDSRTAFTSQTLFVASRLGALGAAIVGILGLLMTAVGIYGTVGFAVAQRTQEIGVRMALGAGRGAVVRLILRETMRPVALGMAIGFALAAAVSRLMHAVQFGLNTLDPVAFLGVSAFLAAVALLAGIVPARRATRIDPTISLRHE